MKRRNGSILVGLLWCVVLLSIIVITVLHTATMDLKVTKNYGDKIQARYLALAGIEKARALIYQSYRDHAQLGKNANGDLFNAPDKFRDVKFGRGEFRVFHRGELATGGDLVFGVSDEESRLNVNIATAEQLTNLDGMTLEVAAAVLSWRGEAMGTNGVGANADYYAGLQPPYLPRSGPFETTRELLSVRGVTPELLFGDDAKQNGLLPANNGAPGEPADDAAVSDNGGWAQFLTVHSTDANANNYGTDRVNIQTADEAALARVNGITSSIARAIVRYRAQKQFQSIADLLDVTPPQPGSQNGQSTPSGSSSANAQTSTTSTDASASPDAGTTVTGGTVVSEQLLQDIADDIAITSDQEREGLINVNTASVETLMCLPGVDREKGRAIHNYVQSEGGIPNIAWLLKVQGMDRTTFKAIAPLVTARSETFRVVSEGRVKSSGAVQRIEVVVHVTKDDVALLSYREDNL